MKSGSASELEREQKVFFSKRRVEERVKPKERAESFFEEKSGRASETEREQKVFRREEWKNK